VRDAIVGNKSKD